MQFVAGVIVVAIVVALALATYQLAVAVGWSHDAALIAALVIWVPAATAAAQAKPPE